jgi:hypothetical protein
MKWLICWLLTLAMPFSAFAGNTLYVAVVGNDIDANTFYLDTEYQQFLYDQQYAAAPVCWRTFPPITPQTRVGGAGCEQFRSDGPLDQPEICDTNGEVTETGDFLFFGVPNVRIRRQNAGYYQWFIRLPLAPSGEINLCIRCGIICPNAFDFFGFESVITFPAETGERWGPGLCAPDSVSPGWNPVLASSLPRITAWAFPGPYALESFPPFNLTAYKNPSDYGLTSINIMLRRRTLSSMYNSESLQVLDGSSNSRILLKSCLDECIVVKRPVAGQLNALGQMEQELHEGDLIEVRMEIPSNNTVDIYCNSQSVKLTGKAGHYF